jgi:hypothetical protein
VTRRGISAIKALEEAMGQTMASGHVVAGFGSSAGGGAGAGAGVIANDGVIAQKPEALANGELLLQVFQQTLSPEQRTAYDRLMCHTRCTQYHTSLCSSISPRIICAGC